MIKNAIIQQVWRFGIVGVGTNVAGFIVYLGVTYAGVPPKIAMSVLYAVGAGLSFVLNRQWTFGHRGGVSGAGLRFAIAHAGGYCVNFGMLLILHDWIGWPHQLVQAMAVMVVAAGLFVAFRLFVFPDRGMS